MYITFDKYARMGFIYINNDEFDKRDRDMDKLERNNYEINEKDNMYLKMNKLNWTNKHYLEGLDEEFREPYQNEFDKDDYLIGIELSLNREKVENIVDNYNLISFDFDDKKFYGANFDKVDNVFNENNYIYEIGKNKDAYLIISEVKEDRYVFTLDDDSKGTEIITFIFAEIKSIIFSEDSAYNLDDFKNFNVYEY